MLGMALAIVASTLGWLAFRIDAGVPVAQARTETFTLLATCEWWNVLNCRSERCSALALDLLRNRWLVAGLVAGNALAVVFWAPLGGIFHTVPFGVEQALWLGVVGSLVLWAEEVRKARARRRAAAPA